MGQTYYDPSAEAEISSIEVETPDGDVEGDSPSRGSYYVESGERHVSWTAELVGSVVVRLQEGGSSLRSSARIIGRILAPFRRGSEGVSVEARSGGSEPVQVQPERRYFTLKKRG